NRVDDWRHFPFEGKIANSIGAFGNPGVGDVVREIETMSLTLAVCGMCGESMIGIEIEGAAVQMLHTEVVLVPRRNRLQEFEYHGVIGKRSFPEIGGHLVQGFPGESAFLRCVLLAFCIDGQEQVALTVDFMKLKLRTYDDLGVGQCVVVVSSRTCLAG